MPGLKADQIKVHIEERGWCLEKGSRTRKRTRERGGEAAENGEAD